MNAADAITKIDARTKTVNAVILLLRELMNNSLSMLQCHRYDQRDLKNLR